MALCRLMASATARKAWATVGIALAMPRQRRESQRVSLTAFDALAEPLPTPTATPAFWHCSAYWHCLRQLHAIALLCRCGGCAHWFLALPTAIACNSITLQVWRMRPLVSGIAFGNRMELMLPEEARLHVAAHVAYTYV